jgi:hypothetical protein
MQSEEFLKVGETLTGEQGCAAVLLTGTDLALVF